MNAPALRPSAASLGVQVHADRRARLRAAVPGPILLIGNGTIQRNLPMNLLRFRQDSSFLYFTGCDEPGAALLMDEAGDTLFLTPPADDDGLWHGHVVSNADRARALGFERSAPIASLEAAVGDRRPATLSVSDPVACARAGAIAGRPLRFGGPNGDEALIDAVIAMRRRLEPVELEALRATSAVSVRAHRLAMAHTRPGRTEESLLALFEGCLRAGGRGTAYDTILTVRGEVLHNHSHPNTLEAGQLLLLDGGGEAPDGYASDITRTWPVSGRFDGRQRAAYEAVLQAQTEAIAAIRPGLRYRDLHLQACRVLARFLVDEGLLIGDPDGLVERGAHALFFPHGLGHLIGLDVHDLEVFGDRAAYAPGRTRSAQFGTGYLRLDLDLEANMLVTIEPGFYVVPAILGDRVLTDRFADALRLDVAERWLGFGGIRIEDDVLVTPEGGQSLSPELERTVAELEALIGTGGPTPF